MAICGTNSCVLAAEGAHLALLQRARQNGCPWDGDTFVLFGCQRWARLAVFNRPASTTIRETKIRVLRWGRRAPCRPSMGERSRLCIRGARYVWRALLVRSVGISPMSCWQDKQPSMRDEHTCPSPARQWYLIIVHRGARKYSYVCPWDRMKWTDGHTPRSSPGVGQNGCPWRQPTFPVAAHGGHVMVFESVDDDGCLRDEIS